MMIKALTYAALLVAIAAGCALLYRNQPYSISIERAGEVKKDVDRAVVQAPAPTPFGPVPNVVVVAAPPPAIPTPQVMPTPALATKKHVAKRKSPAKKLKTKWAAPQERPFSLGDLFNVGR